MQLTIKLTKQMIDKTNELKPHLSGSSTDALNDIDNWWKRWDAYGQYIVRKAGPESENWSDDDIKDFWNTFDQFCDVTTEYFDELKGLGEKSPRDSTSSAIYNDLTLLFEKFRHTELKWIAGYPMRQKGGGYQILSYRPKEEKVDEKEEDDNDNESGSESEEEQEQEQEEEEEEPFDSKAAMSKFGDLFDHILFAREAWKCDWNH